MGLDHPIPTLSFVILRIINAALVKSLLFRQNVWVEISIFSSRKMWGIGILIMLGYVLQFEGQALATGSEAALIIGTAALMIPLIAWISHQESFRPLKSVGVIVGFLGVGLLVAGQGPSNSTGSSHLLGDLLLVATAVTIALVFIYSKPLAMQRGDRAVTGGIVLTTSLLLLPFAPLGQTAQTISDPTAWSYILVLAVFGTVGAYYFFSKSVERVSPTVSSIILPIEVVVSTILSVLLFHESFTLTSGAGAVLIVVGFALVSLR